MKGWFGCLNPWHGSTGLFSSWELGVRPPEGTTFACPHLQWFITLSPPVDKWMEMHSPYSYHSSLCLLHYPSPPKPTLPQGSSCQLQWGLSWIKSNCSTGSPYYVSATMLSILHRIFYSILTRHVIFPHFSQVKIEAQRLHWTPNWVISFSLRTFHFPTKMGPCWPVDTQQYHPPLLRPALTDWANVETRF